MTKIFHYQNKRVLFLVKYFIDFKASRVGPEKFLKIIATTLFLLTHRYIVLTAALPTPYGTGPTYWRPPTDDIFTMRPLFSSTIIRAAYVAQI